MSFLASLRKGRRPLQTLLGSAAEDGLDSDAQEARRAYYDRLENLPLPKGFYLGVAKDIIFFPQELPLESSKPYKLNMALLTTEKPSENFAAVFTKNRFCGHPVTLGRQRLAESTKMGGLLVNNRISNAANKHGMDKAETLCVDVANGLGPDWSAENIAVSSTGIIGWELPMKEMASAIPQLIESRFQVEKEKDIGSHSVADFARAIMTTDAYPKAFGITLKNGAKVVGVAKGAGMIEPNMATMLVFILTDMAVPRATLQKTLDKVVAETFNCISIDADESTSDTVWLLSSNRVPLGGGDGDSDPDAQLLEFQEALFEVSRQLSKEIVRNGEGVKHVIECNVSRAPSFAIAKALAKSVINSPLLKSAIAGNDPNIGRLACALGSALGRVGEGLTDEQLRKTKIFMDRDSVYSNGAFNLTPELERKLTEYMRSAELFIGGKKPDFPSHDRSVRIDVDMDLGQSSCRVYGADLTVEYVIENSQYRS
ncbi:unnamed protein product [Vitrella brassicaformis CCMP3155]|uniref:Arginine biosynthesis bifunctional protein ArgJ, mitochondrial n=2 Tax=Vitrella brassicaformis TaxID=1169539 RepID=A0A0G4ENV2_VITBC|nr:unnamed protein product [Vitrella brassicaformis CCMP3155]|eukprot:CEL99298.1 unnamed protein product [Vitrella brassicaformis CCMP3155]